MQQHSQIELDIKLMLTDDRNATRIIQYCTDIMCVTHWEYIFLCIAEKKLSIEGGQAILWRVKMLSRIWLGMSRIRLL